MSHKVRVDIEFGSMEEYIVMRDAMNRAGIKLDKFVTHSLNLVWNQMLEDYSKQLAAEAGVQYAANSPAVDSDSAGVSLGSSSDSP